MRVLNISWYGGIGGIENLILCIARDKSIDNEVCFFARGGTISDELQKINIPVYHLGAKNGYDLCVLPKFIQIIKKGKYDIVNVHNSPLTMVFTIVAKIFGGKFIIVLTEHADVARKSKKEILFYRLIKFFVKDYIAVSNYVKATMVKEYKININKIQVIYNGVDLVQFNVKIRTPPNHTFEICYVGRLVPKKGVEILLRAFEIFCRDYIEPPSTDAKLVIVGDGSDKKNLESLAQDMGMGKHIEFTGYRRDICEILKHADIFVYPSIYEEAFGISVIEAMAVGVPPIVFNKGGLPEVVDNNINGFIAKDTSVISLAMEIGKAYKLFKENKLDSISRRSVKKAQTFSIKNTVESLKNYYNNLLLGMQ
jgi:glycosyltransferase involved in cell wall biosynthesis